MDEYRRNDSYDRDDRDSGYGNRFVPVRVGEELTVTIEAVGEKGDGLAKVKGFVIFVPGGKSGETVKVRIQRVLKKVAFAELVGAAAPASKTESKESKKPVEEEDSAESSDSSEDTVEDSEEFEEY